MDEIRLDGQGRVGLAPRVAERLTERLAVRRPARRAAPNRNPNTNCSGCNTVKGCGPVNEKCNPNTVPNCGCKRID